MARAKEIIGGMTREIEIGQTYQGCVVSTKEFGAIVEVFTGRDGLVHISELADFRVKRTEDVAKVGDIICVKCICSDDKGLVKLSLKSALTELFLRVFCILVCLCWSSCFPTLRCANSIFSQKESGWL